MYCLCLHNVLAGEIDLYDRKCSRISSAMFSKFLDTLSESYQIVSMNKYLDALDKKELKENWVTLTFDDGFLGVYQEVFPEMNKRGLSGTLFLNPRMLDQGGKEDHFHFLEIEFMFRVSTVEKLKLSFFSQELEMPKEKKRVKAMKLVKKHLKANSEDERVIWMQELYQALGVSKEDVVLAIRADEKRSKTMTAENALEMKARGWELGAHSLTHRSLGMLGDEEVQTEILGSISELEDMLKMETRIFAYPYGEAVHVGKFAPKISNQAGMKYSFTTIAGLNGAENNPQLMNRFDYKEFCRDVLKRNDLLP